MEPRTASLVIEMDNARHAEAQRTVALLAALSAEVATLARTGIAGASPIEIDVVIVHHPASVSRAAIDAIVERSQARLALRVLAADDASGNGTYYDLKNLGARATAGALLVFLDSDVIPEPGCLGALLAPFSDAAVEVVSGTTYIDPVATTWDKAFALFWIFPLRSAGGAPREVADLMPNCVAFRRALFERFPFPATGTYRRGGERLSRALRRAGVAIWCAPDARVRHPPPLPLVPVVVRALQEGFDRFQDKVARKQRRAGPVGAVRGLGTSLGGPRRRILDERRAVGLTRAETPFALALATAYELAVRVGYVATLLHAPLIPALTGRP